MTSVDLRTSVGSVELPSPVLTASGTAGHGCELGRFVDLSRIGAVVVKSLSADPWPGNPAPRVHETTAGMINSVGLQGPGVDAWIEDDLPQLVTAGARVVASIWGTSVEDYERAAVRLAGVEGVVAVEVNLSCPNLRHEGQPGEVAGHVVFAHDAALTRDALAASAACGRPLWAKLSPNVTDIPAIAGVARDAGAEAVTLVNTLMAMAIDPATRRPRLGAATGGLSGPAIHPVAVRAVWDVHAAHPDLPIVGVGGVATGEDAVELLLAGAQAVQVGTASFADPRAVARISTEVGAWCRDEGVDRLDEIIGGAHG